MDSGCGLVAMTSLFTLTNDRFGPPLRSSSAGQLGIFVDQRPTLAGSSISDQDSRLLRARAQGAECTDRGIWYLARFESRDRRPVNARPLGDF